MLHVGNVVSVGPKYRTLYWRTRDQALISTFLLLYGMDGWGCYPRLELFYSLSSWIY